MGLINRVIPEADLGKETRNWAAILAQKSPLALQIAKKAFYAAADLDYYKNRVVPEADLTRKPVTGLRFGAKESLALQIAKKAFYAAADLDYYKSFEYMNEAFARLCSTEDAKEGISAFLGKRSPAWKQK